MQPFVSGHEIREIEYVGSRACFTVQTEEKPVYMCIERTNYRNDDRAVVVVDAEKFLALWRANPKDLHADVSSGGPEEWRKDYKFNRAERGFSHGFANPVPLADASCWMLELKRPNPLGLRTMMNLPPIEEVPCVGLTNGVTRTIWLLANGCKAFPIMCRMSGGAQLLYERAGFPGTALLTVEELFG